VRPLLASLLCTLAGCLAPSMDLPDEGAAPDAGSFYADTLVDVTTGGTINSCIDDLPECSTDLVTGDCSANPILGPMDGASFSLNADDRIEVAFRCQPVVEKGSSDGMPSNELTIWATVPDGASAEVSVSFDGSSYLFLSTLDTSNKSFDIALSGLSLIRFVRISGISGTISIDAIEAL
jgi:hypothetical protein